MTLHERWKAAKTLFLEDDVGPYDGWVSVHKWLKDHVPGTVRESSGLLNFLSKEDWGDCDCYDLGNGYLVTTGPPGYGEVRQEP